MVAGLYPALKDAGAQEAMAKQAAEDVANFEALAHYHTPAFQPPFPKK